MAVHRSFDSLAKKFVVYSKRVLKNTEETMRKAALAAHQVFATGTPVDTGRARGSWTMSIATFAPDADLKHGFSGELEGRKAAATEHALAQGIAMVSSYKLGSGSIFITNSVPYIEPLDEGWSAQAPDGFSDEAIAVANHIIQTSEIVGK